MRKLIVSSLGILCGIAVIIMAFCVKAVPDEFEEASFAVLSAASSSPSSMPDVYIAEHESNKYYGGDAYSGMQQASAQAANNILAMEETLLQTNENIMAVNRNLRTVSENLKGLNENLAEAADVQKQNLEAASRSISGTVARIGFFLLLAMGLIMLVSNVSPFLDALDVFLEEKKKAAEAVAEEPVSDPVEAFLEEKKMSEMAEDDLIPADVTAE